MYAHIYVGQVVSEVLARKSKTPARRTPDPRRGEFKNPTSETESRRNSSSTVGEEGRTTDACFRWKYRVELQLR